MSDQKKKNSAYNNFLALHNSINKRLDQRTTNAQKSIPQDKPSVQSEASKKIATKATGSKAKNAVTFTPARTRQEYDSAIATGKKELSRLEELLSKKQDFGTFLRNTYTMTPAAASAQEAATRDAWAKEYGYGSWKDAQNRYDLLKAETGQMEKELRYGYLSEEPDYKYFSALGASAKNPAMDEVEKWIGGADVANIVTYSRENADKIAMGESNNSRMKGRSIYQFMTDQEVQNYNYLLAKEGAKSADGYLEFLEADLQKRQAEPWTESLQGIQNPVGKAVAQGAYGFAAGIDRAMSGYTPDQPTSAIQHTSQELQQDMSDVGRVFYAAAENVGNMAPSVLVSSLLGGIGAPAQLAQAAGNITMGTSVAGNAYKQAIEDGYGETQARNYGTLVGLSETMLQKLLGGISALGGISDTKIMASLSHIDNALLRGAAKLGVNLAGEIAEEELQNYLEPAFRTILFGEDYDAPTIDELVETALVTAITVGAMEGPVTAAETISEEVDKTAAYREIAPDLVAESQELSGDTELGTKIQERIDSGKKVSGRDLRNLVAQNEQAIATQTATQAEAMLTERGETGNVAEVAQVVGKMATGQRLTRQEMQIFRESQNAADVLNEINEAEATNEMPVQEATETAQEAQIPTPVEVEGESGNVAVEAPVAQESASVPAPVAEVVEPTETNVKAAQGATLYEDESRELEANSKQYGEQAEAYIQSFDAGQNVAEYDTAWKAGYELGMSQVPQAQAMESSDLAYLTPGQRVDAYEAGLKAAGVMAEQKEARVQGMTQNATGARKRGIVRAYNGINTATLAQKFNDSQRKAYKILSTIADVTGIEIVLYESSPEADGVYREAQGKYIRSQPGRIFVDLNAGISHVSEVGDMANYTMLATFTHEFVHFCENWNPIRYNELRKAVFDAMAENNINVEERIDQLMANSKGELSREDASREAVAEALVEILPDANFVEQLANEHKTLFRKLLERLKEFFQEIKDYFSGMRKSNDPTAAALKEEVDGMTRYMEHIVKLFDNVAVEAVNRMQASEFVQKSIFGDVKIDEQKSIDIARELEADANVVERSPEDATMDVDGDELPAKSLADMEMQIENRNETVPAHADTEKATENLRKAIRMPIEGTNEEALLAGIRSGELSMESVTLGSKVAGFNDEQRVHLARELIRGVYTDSENLHVSVPYDGTFDIENTPENVVQVLNRLHVKATQKILFGKKDIRALGDNKKYIIEIDGERFLSDGAFSIKVDEASEQYAKQEMDAKDRKINPAISEWAKKANTPLLKAPVLVKSGKLTYLRFEIEGQPVYFQPIYFDAMDGNRYYYSKNGDLVMVKAVRPDGQTRGWLLNAKVPGRTQEMSKLPKLKSFSTKILDQLWEAEEIPQFQRRPSNRLSDREVLNAAADGLEGLSLTEAEENSLGVMRQKLARLAPISDQIEEHERLAEEYAERDPEEAQKERNRAIVLKAKQTRELNSILAGANGPIMRRVLQKARSIVERQELTEYRASRKESELAKRYKARIEKDVNELIAWGMKPDTKNAMKHIPEGIKGPVMDFLETIDFSSKRKLAGGADTQKDERFLEKMATLKKVLEPMRPNGEENLDKTRLSEEFFVKLDDLSNNITRTAQAIHSFDAGVIVNEMESSDLKRLADIIKGLKRLITEYNRTYKNAVYESIDKAGKNSVEMMQKMKPLKSNAATEFLEFDQTRPAYIFERFGEGGKSIWQELQNGQSRFGFMAKEIIDFSEKTYTAKEVKAWEKEVKTIKLSDDSTVEMTIAQIMSLYKLQAREQALGHLLGNGIRIPNYKIGNKKYTDNGHFLNREDIDNICGVLTARQKAVADKLQAFMQETGSQWGNEVTMVRFGERLFGEKNYFPIHSDGGNIPGTLDEHLESQSLYAMLNMGFTKRTQEGANNRIIVHSIFDEYAAHMSNMAKYNAFALPVLDTLRWLNYTDEQNPNIGVRQEMARVYGRRSGSDKATAELFVTNLLKALNGTENASLKKTEQTAIRLLGRYNRAQVAANLSVAIQQPLSVIRSVEEFGVGSLIVAMGTNTKAIRKNWKEMEGHSGIAVWKQLGFYDINISRGLSSMIKHDESTVDKLTEWSMGAASFADRLTWGWMWEIAKQDVKQKKKLKPSDEGYWDAVTKAFEDVIFKTQVVDSPLTKTEAMRNNSFWAKSIYSFMSEPITALSMTTNAVSQFRRGIAEGKSTSELWRTNGKKMGRTFMVNAVSLVINAAVTAALRDALRDDDEYENYGEKFMQAFRKNLFSELIPLNNIPELSGMLNGVLLTLKDIGVIEGEFADSIFEEKSTTESILDAIKNAVYIPYQKIWGKGSNYTWYGAVYNALKAASGITGLPAASGIRELVTMWNNTMAPILEKLYPKSEWVLRTYEPDPKQEIREAYESGYLTDEEALEAMQEKKVSVPDSYLKTPEVAYKGYLRYWAYKSANPKDESVEDTWFIAYGAKGVDTAGIKQETYLDYRKKARDKKNERKTWTDKKKEETSEKEMLLDLIDSMNLTSKQKDALYAAEGWSTKTISEAPWH